MAKSAIDIAEALERLSALTIFELRGEWRRLIFTPSLEFATMIRSRVLASEPSAPHRSASEIASRSKR